MIYALRHRNCSDSGVAPPHLARIAHPPVPPPGGTRRGRSSPGTSNGMWGAISGILLPMTLDEDNPALRADNTALRDDLVQTQALLAQLQEHLAAALQRIAKLEQQGPPTAPPPFVKPNRPPPATPPHPRKTTRCGA